MRLALALGKTVRQLLAEMDSAELSEWLAFNSEYNLPDGFFVAATTSMAVARSIGGSKVEAGDFAPIFRVPAREQTAEEAIARLRAFSAAHNR